MGILSFQNDLLMANPHLETASGAIATFNTNFKAPLKSLKVNIEPVQSGSGDPSPDNVRPITGWTGATVTHTGTNLFGGEVLKNQIMKATGAHGTSGDDVVYWGATASGTVFPSSIGFETNTQYTFIFKLYRSSVSATSGSWGTNMRIYYTNGSYTNIMYTPAGLNVYVTFRLVSAANRTVRGIYIYNQGNTTYLKYNESGVFKGVHTLDEFQPFGQEIPISWETEAGTVYGGTATYNGDGTWTITSKAQIYTFNGSTTKFTFKGTDVSHNGTTYHNYYYISSDGETWNKKSMWVPSSFDYSWYFKCSHAPTVFISETYEDATLLYSAYIGSGKVLQPRLLFNSSTGIDTLAKANSFLATQYENSTPVVIAYPLKTATVTTITTEELIYTLKGENNIWADTGNVEVRYWKH